jgi:hypothetical protein
MAKAEKDEKAESKSTPPLVPGRVSKPTKPHRMSD